jgi:molybdate transport system substrate-binding protein
MMRTGAGRLPGRPRFSLCRRGQSLFRATKVNGAVVTLALGATLLAPIRIAAQKQTSITVSAAISLKDALDELGHLYEQRHVNAKMTFNYGGSGTLQHQIEQGAPVDIFFSAAEKQMDALESEDLLVAGTRRDLVANKLVLVAPVESSAPRDFPDLARPEVKIIALGEPGTVPAGMYAHQTLEHLGLLDAIRKKVVYAKDVRAVLTYVETGNADAGFVYQTGARGSAKVRIVAAAPAGTHDPIVYPVAIMKNSKDKPAARAFLEFLESSDARAVFEKYGFAAPEKQAGKN